MLLYKPGRPIEVHPIDPNESRKIPKSKGEYRILNGSTGEVMYIGVSNDLNRREREHERSGKINFENNIFAYNVADGRASQSRINDHEREKIRQHNPSLNQRAGGAGRPYGKHK